MNADSTRVAARSAEEAGEPSGWARHGWVLPAVWLIFLGYTVGAVLAEGLGPAGTAAGLGLVVLFAGIYLAAFVALDRPNGGGLRFAHWNWAGLGSMLAVMLGMGALIGMEAIYMAPFIPAYACYLLPRRSGWWVGLGSIAGALALVLAVGQPGDYMFIVFIMVGVFVVNMVTSALMEADSRSRRIGQDLAVVSERERVARDVHDVLGHTLTVVAVKAELAERLLDIDPERSRSEIAEIRGLVRGALADVRATVGGLRGTDFRTQIQALEITLAGAGLDVEVETGDPAAIDPHLVVPLGWVLREAGTNVLRHARATRCHIRLEPGRLSIEDDGVGLAGKPAGNGLLGMRERMDDAGARLAVGAAAAGGTRVEVTW